METISFTFKHRKSLAYKISSFAVLFFGILWFQFFIFGGIVLTVGSLFFIVKTKGIEIDLKNKKYRNTTYVVNMPIGTWKDLPKIKYISVFKTNLVQGVRGLGQARVTNRHEAFHINFIHSRNQRLTVYKTYESDDAFEKARFFSEKLNLKIYDASSRDAKWLD